MLKSAEIGASGPNNKETGDAEKTDLEKIDEAIDRKLRRIYKKINKTVNVILAGSSLVGIGWFAHDQVGNNADNNKKDQIQEKKYEVPETFGEIPDTIKYNAESENNNQFTGEMWNGVTYDYTEYSDYENKLYQKDFGSDHSDCYGDIEKTREGIEETAKDMPQAMGSYAYFLISDEDKKELGIYGLDETEIINKIITSEDGGKLQKSVNEKITDILSDSDTNYRFFYETGTGHSRSLEYEDKNKDDKVTADEVQLSYTTVSFGKRAKTLGKTAEEQVEITTKDGKKMTVNLDCDFQPTTKEKPTNLPEIENPPTENVVLPAETTHSEEKSNTDEPETPPGSDAKNAQAIQRNMQTGTETNNYVTPTGPGDPEARPDTSNNSYDNEQQYQQQAVQQTWEAPSESNDYSTIGEAIGAADQTYADHENYTPEQQAEQVQAAQAQAEQNAATETAKAIEQQSKPSSNEEAADWFNNLNNGGGQ